MAKIHKRRHLQNSLVVAGALASDTATRLNHKSGYPPGKPPDGSPAMCPIPLYRMVRSAKALPQPIPLLACGYRYRSRFVFWDFARSARGKSTANYFKSSDFYRTRNVSNSAGCGGGGTAGGKSCSAESKGFGGAGYGRGAGFGSRGLGSGNSCLFSPRFGN